MLTGCFTFTLPTAWHISVSTVDLHTASHLAISDNQYTLKYKHTSNSNNVSVRCFDFCVMFGEIYESR